MIEARNKYMEKLIAQGVAPMQARFMAMTAGAEATGLLEDQPTEDEEDPDTAALIKLAAKARQENRAEEAAKAEAQKAAVADAYQAANNQAGLTNIQVGLLIRYGFGEDTGYKFSEAEEDDLRGWRFVPGLTAQQMAERTGTHESTWRRKAIDGEVVAVKAGKGWLFPAYLANEYK